MVYSLPLWQEIAIYSYVFLAIVIFALLSKLRIFGINLIPIKFRVLISLFSPIILILLLALSPLLILAAVFGLLFLKRSNKTFKIEIKKF